jgi:hypothetical protein
MFSDDTVYRYTVHHIPAVPYMSTLFRLLYDVVMHSSCPSSTICHLYFCVLYRVSASMCLAKFDLGLWGFGHNSTLFRIRWTVSYNRKACGSCHKVAVLEIFAVGQ